MTAKTKWWIVAGAVAVALLGIGAVIIGLFVLDLVPRHPFLPVYTHGQTDSTHPWHRHSTVTRGGDVFVNDFEEAALLPRVHPHTAIGRAPIGNALVCAIDGQPTNTYIAVDCGSEMEAYAVYRSAKQPPFDWRHAKFQALEIGSPTIHPERKRSTDPALLTEVVRTLSEGTPTAKALPATLTNGHMAGLQMYSEEIPGLVFSPQVYLDESGVVYLAENVGVEYTNRTQKLHAAWITAGSQFTEWLKSR